MFSALRPNSIIYILDKKNTPTLNKGTVVTITAPRSKSLYSNPLDMVVDIEVKVNDVQESFKNIPANLNIANDGNMIIAETKELMCSEVEAMISNSKSIIDSVEYHKTVLSSCEEMLKELNPQIAKEKEQESKINALEDKVDNVEKSLLDIKEMLAKALIKN